MTSEGGLEKGEGLGSSEVGELIVRDLFGAEGTSKSVNGAFGGVRWPGWDA